MISIAEVADRIGERLGEQSGLKSEVKKLCYGIECLLIMSISISIFLGCGWFCGAFKETAVITLAALVMKHIIGGPHLSGFLRCTGFSTLILVGAAWLLKSHGSPSPWCLLVLAALGSVIIWFYGPLLPSELNLNKHRVKIRRVAGISILIVVTGLLTWHPNLWLTSLMIGFLLTILLRTPIGVLIVQWIEKITNRKEVLST
jgi:accessory gene regulator B